MHFTISLPLLLYAVAVSAQTLTGNDCKPAANYILCQDLWGSSSGTGEQNSTLITAAGNVVSWSTDWTWANNAGVVKSYANVGSNTAKGIQLSAISRAPTSWQWEISAQSGTRADVSYDIWFGASQAGSAASSASSYEIMIWLSNIGGISPIGSQITTDTAISNYTWNLWSGTNENWHVYSFVSSKGDIKSFNADLKDFFEWLITNQGVSSAQYLQQVQAGTEALTGSANLTTHNYEVSVTA